MQEDRDYNENKDPENVPENGSESDVTGVSEKGSTSENGENTEQHTWKESKAAGQTDAEGFSERGDGETIAYRTAGTTDGGKNRRFPVWQIGVAAIAFGLIAAIVFQFSSLALSRILPKDEDKIKVVSTFVTGDKTAAANDVSEVVAELMPAMVSINVVSTVHASNGIFSYEYEATGAGSGVIFGQSDTSLYIMTNYHVIDGAKSIAVSFVDNTAYYVSVKGYDEATDLAVLEIRLSDMKSETKSAIAIAVFGSSAELKLGERVIAIGNALGYGQTVTVGYVSALDRKVQDEDGYVKSMIQTDAAINAGNSGGALINAKGEVIGINSMKNITENTDNIGYAIPIDTVKTVTEEILTRTVYSGTDVAYLGITGAAVSDVYYNYANLGIPAGIYISAVADNMPAAKAGLRAGDIITAFDGKTVVKMTTLQTYLTYKTSGDTATLTVARKQNSGKYETLTLTVNLVSKKDAGISE